MTNNIVLGSRDDSSHLESLKSLGVTHMLNLTNVVPNSFPDQFIYHNISITGNLLYINNHVLYTIYRCIDVLMY